MNIIAVDDEHAALQELKDVLHKVADKAEINLFSSAREALTYARKRVVDVAFLDIEMAEMNGLLLAKYLKERHGDTNIIFVTAHSSYMSNAFRLHASGYVMKPAMAPHIAKELENLRRPVRHPDVGIRIQCFGNFEVFMNGRPVTFGRAKAKEMLAYLVDRHGASATNKEIAAILWEDEPYDRSRQKQLDNIICELLRSLDRAGISSVIVRSTGTYAINTAAVYCDLYEYEKGDAYAVNCYHGRYMENYSWSEFTTGRLDRMK